MYLIVLDKREIYLKLSLRALKMIQTKFKKPYMEVLQVFDKLSVDEQLDVLSFALMEEESNVKREDFKALCEEELSLGELIKIFAVLITKAMQPKRSIEEIEEEYEKEQKNLNLKEKVTERKNS